MPDPRHHDEHRTGLGFLTVGQVDALADRGVRVLDPFSALISASAEIGPGTVVYPNVVVQCDPVSTLLVGSRNLLYPGTFLLADSGGQLLIGNDCELGPGGVQVKANRADAHIRLGDGGRLLNGCELTGRSELGDGCQIIGPIQAQSVRLAGGLGGYAWPDPDGRGALLKGAGLARDISLARGEVMNGQGSFASSPVERQASYHR
ncbi:MAG TPA: hypothetical protein VGI58_19680 [Streptosporangiaceae bacterium]|jgi:carbonic anhydrase/acetyltransferase-like protein (isoleucine patch superfamily)